jgi:hypothetical protein
VPEDHPDLVRGATAEEVERGRRVGELSRELGREAERLKAAQLSAASVSGAFPSFTRAVCD